jgi:predicted nucleic acid-binding protein
VAEPDAAVTDTHPLLFHAAGTGRLGTRAAALFERCERGDAIVYVPGRSAVGNQSPGARGPRASARSRQGVVRRPFSNPAYQPLDLTSEHVYAADDLGFTRDPFDALIVASAQVLGLKLITRDGPIRDSGAVAVLW